MKKLLLITATINDLECLKLIEELKKVWDIVEQARGPKKIKDFLDNNPDCRIIWKLEKFNFELACDIVYILNLVKPKGVVIISGTYLKHVEIKQQLKVPIKSIVSVQHSDVILNALNKLDDNEQISKGSDEMDDIDFIRLFKKNRDNNSDVSEDVNSKPSPSERLKYPNIAVNNEEKNMLSNTPLDSGNTDEYIIKVPAPKKWLDSLKALFTFNK